MGGVDAATGKETGLEVVRQIYPKPVSYTHLHTFFRDTFFTNVKKSTTERVDIDLVKGDRRMAAFVHPGIRVM